MNGKGLTDRESALIKTMQARGKSAGFTAQKILSYFSRPERTINVARLYEIRDGMRGANVPAASEEDLHSFLTQSSVLKLRRKTIRNAPCVIDQHQRILESVRVEFVCCLVKLIKMICGSRFGKNSFPNSIVWRQYWPHNGRGFKWING